jgi:hypothetical protein
VSVRLYLSGICDYCGSNYCQGCASDDDGDDDDDDDDDDDGASDEKCSFIYDIDFVCRGR